MLAWPTSDFLVWLLLGKQPGFSRRNSNFQEKDAPFRPVLAAHALHRPNLHIPINESAAHRELWRGRSPRIPPRFARTAQLPVHITLMSQQAIARVSRRAAGRWQRGHPWIYRSDVMAAPDVAAGAVRVLDEQGRFLGRALWSPTSQISLRMLTSDDRAIDTGFWRERISAAVSYRETLHIAGSAYRLIHGEADGMPSLVVDKYGDYLVAQFLSAGLEAFRADIVNALRERVAARGLLARNDPAVRGHEQLTQTTELL